MSKRDEEFMTSWCGGVTGNAQCGYSCKVCLIFSGKAVLVGADDESRVLTYVVPSDEANDA